MWLDARLKLQNYQTDVTCAAIKGWISLPPWSRPAAHKRNPPGERHHPGGPRSDRASTKRPIRSRSRDGNDVRGELLRYAAGQRVLLRPALCSGLKARAAKAITPADNIKVKINPPSNTVKTPTWSPAAPTRTPKTSLRHKSRQKAAESGTRRLRWRGRRRFMVRAAELGAARIAKVAFSRE
jgi:hypothetical protein